MNTTIPLQQLEEQLHQRESRFRDQTIPATNIRMDDRGDLVVNGDSHPSEGVSPRILTKEAGFVRLPSWPDNHESSMREQCITS